MLANQMKQYKKDDTHEQVKVIPQMKAWFNI